MEKQIELLKKYGVTNYTIAEDKIIINGDLYLSSLTSADKDFLKGTTIGGDLYLSSLTSADKDFLKKNVKQIIEGFNKKGNYCYFDGILRKVKSITKKKGYTIYTTPFDFVVKKGKYTAHGKTVKKAIQDLEFKIVSEKLKKDPIKKDTVITIPYYRLITGSCESGVQSWINNHFNEKEKAKVLRSGITAEKLLPILQKNNAYGIDKFLSLCSFNK